MPLLTGPEMRRLIARHGGLWTGAELRKFAGEHARHWPSQKGFPEPAWVMGRSKLFSGWDVWHWLLQTDRLYDARLMEAELKALRQRKFR